MGCAGSKPHLPSLSSNHINSPQKGFILFNAKTIEYLSANETEIKSKLIQRCEAKLIKPATISQSKSLLGNAKRSLLPSSQSNQQMPPNGKDTNIAAGADDSLTTSKKSNLSLANSSLISTQFGNEYKPKEFAIYSAVDYVLKYAINDFDIENFKSSNHLSMKQIRKDIMKKYTSSRQSSSKLNSSISNNNSMNNTSTNTMTLKCQDTAFYKLALHTAIDEFGSFIQENFININEFQPIIKEKSVEAEDDVNKNGANDDNQSNTSSLNDKEALKLKEALEVARQNFYKGKMSMVCLNKAGGYVVKEVKDQPNDTSILDKSPSAKNTTISQSPTKESELDQEVSKIVSEKQQADSLAEFLRIKTDSAKYLSETIDAIVSYTTKSGIFNDITSLEFEDEKEKSSFIAQLQSAFDQCLILKENLEKSNHLIELLSSINEKDYGSIDEKLIDLTVNLDYVNKEFKSYLKLLDDSLRHQLNHISKLGEENSNLLIKENSTKILEKNSEIIKLVNDLYSNINSLPKKLFMSKDLPHPIVANHSPSLSSTSPPVSPKPTQPPSITIDKASSVSPSVSISNELVVKQNSPPSKQHQDNEEQEKNAHSQPINIKKEIAYSILNIGEVLAKQIDYYSLDTNGKDGGEELNELIKLSEKQAAYEKQKLESQQQKMSKSNSSSSTKSSTDQSSVKQEEENNQNQRKEEPAVTPAPAEEKTTEIKESVVEVLEVNNKDDELLDQNNKNNESIESAGDSSLSSPSLSNSLSPMSNSGSTSPVNDVVDVKQEEKEKEEAILITQDEQKMRPPPTSSTTNASTDYEDLEKAKHQLSNHDEVSIQDDEIAYLVKEINMNMKLDTKNDKIELESNEVTNVILVENSGASSEPKSSSSSSDVLSTYNNNDKGENVHKYIENIIENASQRVNESNAVVFRNNENTNKNDNNNTNSNRMSLDEELLYQLEQVDKKVKYMNETCSENEEDDEDEDLDDENFDFDESNSNDEKLFHPTRTPAKIKSQVRQNRTVDLHEEIKQISNVIHDLVQTINVNRNANQPEVEVEEQQVTSDNNSEDGSHNSGGSLSGGEYPLTKKTASSIPSPVIKVNISTSSTGIENSKKLNNSVKRNGSTASQGSSIPIRQAKISTKQRGQTFEEDQTNNNESSINSESFKSAVNFESFVDLSNVSNKSNKKTATPDRLNKSLSTSSSSSSSSNSSYKGNNTPNNTPISNQTTPSSQKFRSKLPVKK